ncbi:ABC transporter transmembrane region 2-domain-containing protein [Amanita rubescens]|nr:ABC transporter transmembrane region 2-domain-containing protein [Amanita rubescens]
MAVFSKPATRCALAVILLAFLLQRSRFVRFSRHALTRLAEKALTPSEIIKATQQVYLNDPDGGKTLLVLYRDRLSKVKIQPTPVEVFASDAPHFPPIPSSVKAKPNIDAAFLQQFRAILSRIAFPHLQSKETLIVFSHSCFLILRTVLSIAVAKLDGVIVRDLVKGDGKGFLRGLGLWFLLAIPSTYTNSMIRHLQSKLSLRLRTRLTRYIHDLYLSAFPYLRYYRSGLEGVDQYITADVDAWAESLSGLYGNILKPSLDLVLFTSQLSRSLGFRGTVLLFANYYATITILRAVTPAFGRLAAVEARLEGEYRAGMGRIGREAEEIAFYNGGLREKDVLTKAYLKLIRHVNSIYKIRIAYEWTEDYVIKYLWSAAGYGLIAVPLLYTRARRSIGIQAGEWDSRIVERPDDAVAERTETYISNRRLLLSLADAGGRVMYAYKDLLELAGLTTRLYTLISTLHNLPPLPQGEVSPDNGIIVEHADICVPSQPQNGTDENGFSSSHAHHHVHPPLVKDLSLILRQGEHLMITGSNGVGKTSVARVLAGLWPPSDSGNLLGGTSARVQRPPARSEDGKRNVFVVPQRSYMVSGSLLDQVIYPDSYADFVDRCEMEGGVEEGMKKLMEILRMVHLDHLPEREGGWFTRKEWRDVLSGGEKQRMGMARVFYQLPKFAILDECTSAVSSDVEGQMYESAKSLGITLITISLRPSLAKYHRQLLTLQGEDGSARWTLTKVGTEEERMGIDREIKVLEERLAEVEGWEKRVKELESLLGVQKNTHELLEE